MQSYSVVIPAFNAAATIAESLESILGQTMLPETIVVVDDGSTDNTQAVVNTYGDRVQLLTQANRGPGAATNLGVQQCETSIIATLDSDDLWLPSKMDRQLSYLQCTPNCSAVFAQMQCFGHPKYDQQIQDGWSRTTMVFRRPLFTEIGGFMDPPGRRGEMVDWLAKGREAGFVITHLNEVLAKRRIRPGSLAFGRDDLKDRGYLHIARAALLRKRVASGLSAASQ